MDESEVIKWGELCGYWRDVLKLNDWKIVFKVNRKGDMELDNVQGEAKFVHSSREAIIRILDPIDWDNPDFEQDIEKTIVHELLHLRFSPIDTDNELIDKLQHQIIDDLAKSFVSLKRELEKEKVNE
jgi:hypothetical protein